MSYKVFLVKESGMPRNHHVIFVETQADGSCEVFQVTGDVQNGMRHDRKLAERPQDSVSWAQVKKLLGTVQKENLELLDKTCRNIPAPHKQFDGPKHIDPDIPLSRCQEWTAQAIETLKRDGIMRDAVDKKSGFSE